jgi:serine phosphatase RsbU (regulator of sigma subunit)
MVGSLPIGTPRCEPRHLERPLAPGGRLVMYSDGLVEAVDGAGDPLSYRRLEELLWQAGGLGGGELTAAILGALDRHLNGRQIADDLTIVVVEAGGAPASASGGAERSHESDS